MGDRKRLAQELEKLPDVAIEEVWKLVLALQSGKVTVNEEAILSESVLAREWLMPEEEEAWASLQ